jgi:hypothetical protein
MQLTKDEVERVVDFGAWLFDAMRAAGDDSPWSEYWTAIGFRVCIPDPANDSTAPENRLSLRYAFRHGASGVVSEYCIYGGPIDALRYGEDHLASDFGPGLQFHLWEDLESDPSAGHAGEHWVTADSP